MRICYNGSKPGTMVDSKSSYLDENCLPISKRMGDGYIYYGTNKDLHGVYGWREDIQGYDWFGEERRYVK